MNTFQQASGCFIGVTIENVLTQRIYFLETQVIICRIVQIKIASILKIFLQSMAHKISIVRVADVRIVKGRIISIIENGGNERRLIDKL